MEYRNRIILFCTSLFIHSCDLERVELGTGNQTKFETAVGGNGNDYPNDIIITSDGGYMVAGYSRNTTPGSDDQAYLIKLNAQGAQVWDASFGGIKADYAKGVIETSDGGFILCGYSYATNNYDIYLVKVNGQGNKVWEKSYGSVDTSELGIAIVPIGASDFYVLYNIIYGTQFINLLRINANGSKISTRTVKTGDYSAYDMIKTTDGKIVIVGIAPSGSYILKLNEDGSYNWENQFPQTGSNFNPAYGVTELSNKDLVLAGSYLGPNDHDFNLVSFNQIGGNNWDKSWGGASADELLGIVTSKDNQLVVMGYTGSFSGKTEIYLSKRSATNGDKLWEKNFIDIGGVDGNIASCPDGGFILCAEQLGNNPDIIIVKTDSEGNYK